MVGNLLTLSWVVHPPECASRYVGRRLVDRLAGQITECRNPWQRSWGRGEQTYADRPEHRPGLPDLDRGG